MNTTQTASIRLHPPAHAGVSTGGVGSGFFAPMKTYAEKLKDPRWQRKRLEILERDQFTCRHCEAIDRTLHVHHRIYLKGAAPWEYQDCNFVTLCHQCHEEAENRRYGVLMSMGGSRDGDRAILNISSVFVEDTDGFKSEVWREAAEELAACIGFGSILHDDFAHELAPEITTRREALKLAASAAIAAIENVVKELCEDS